MIKEKKELPQTKWIFGNNKWQIYEDKDRVVSTTLIDIPTEQQIKQDSIYRKYDALELEERQKQQARHAHPPAPVSSGLINRFKKWAESKDAGYWSQFFGTIVSIVGGVGTGTFMFLKSKSDLDASKDTINFAFTPELEAALKHEVIHQINTTLIPNFSDDASATLQTTYYQDLINTAFNLTYSLLQTNYTEYQKHKHDQIDSSMHYLITQYVFILIGAIGAGTLTLTYLTRSAQEKQELKDYARSKEMLKRLPEIKNEIAQKEVVITKIINLLKLDDGHVNQNIKFSNSVPNSFSLADYLKRALDDYDDMTVYKTIEKTLNNSLPKNLLKGLLIILKAELIRKYAPKHQRKFREISLLNTTTIFLLMNTIHSIHLTAPFIGIDPFAFLFKILIQTLQTQPIMELMTKFDLILSQTKVEVWNKNAMPSSIMLVIYLKLLGLSESNEYTLIAMNKNLNELSSSQLASLTRYIKHDALGTQKNVEKKINLLIEQLIDKEELQNLLDGAGRIDSQMPSRASSDPGTHAVSPSQRLKDLSQIASTSSGTTATSSLSAESLPRSSATISKKGKEEEIGLQNVPKT